MLGDNDASVCFYRLVRIRLSHDTQRARHILPNLPHTRNSARGREAADTSVWKKAVIEFVETLRCRRCCWRAERDSAEIASAAKGRPRGREKAVRLGCLVRLVLLLPRLRALRDAQAHLQKLARRRAPRGNREQERLLEGMRKQS
jgi:hypothetical protein